MVLPLKPLRFLENFALLYCLLAFSKESIRLFSTKPLKVVNSSGFITSKLKGIYTISKLPGPKLDQKTVSSFHNGLYKNKKLAADTKFYKYHGVNNRTGKKISWVTNKKYASENKLRRDLAIREDWGVKIDKVSEFNVPKGTWISEGKAAAKGNGYSGGGYQAVIQNLPKSQVIRTDKVFK
jgi:hypothetical protein